jgi:hypothetical protein
MGRQLQLSGRRGYSVWTLSLARQVVQKKFNRLDVRLYGPEAQSLIWKLHAAEVQSSGH